MISSPGEGGRIPVVSASLTPPFATATLSTASFRTPGPLKIHSSNCQTNFLKSLVLLAERVTTIVALPGELLVNVLSRWR